MPGTRRQYFDGLKQHNKHDRNKKPDENIMRFRGCLPQALVFMVSYAVKEYKIEKGNFVIWDEAHFGKFSQSYLNRTFYFDVHPPLGKMLTALSGYVYRQSDAFKFTSKEPFPDRFDYVGMRRLHAFIASFVPFFAYLILREFGFSVRRSMVCTALFVFENGMTSISRLILLDSHLLAFTAATGYFLVCFYNSRVRPGDGGAGRRLDVPALVKLGLILGCVISIKWIGCLTMLLVGIYIISDLYEKLLSARLSDLLRDFATYALSLIALPLLIYVLLFYVHFRIVKRSGDDDSFMSTRFQLGLENNPFQRTRKYVSFGKQVTIKSARGYLHSHRHAYPGGEDGDEPVYQSTTYGAKDSNNNFYFQNVTDDQNVGFLRSSDRIVLHHAETKSYVEPDDMEAYLSEGRRVVNRRGQPTKNTVWAVEPAERRGREGEKINAVTSRFYLKNVEKGCYLSTSDKNYPSWGFNQGEVCCKSARDKSGMWQIEENFWAETEGNPLYKSTGSSFVSNLIEHNVLMYTTNNGFMQNADLEPERIVSSPVEWPMLRRGLRMSQWGEKHKFYMFMNPFSLYMTTVSILLSPLLFVARLVMSRRRAERRRSRSEKAGRGHRRRALYLPVLHRSDAKVALVGGTAGHGEGLFRPETGGVKARLMNREAFFIFVSLGGWCAHYLAFFCVGRVLYLHHYFPALFFGLLNLCYVMRFVEFKYVCLFVSVAVGTYVLYAPLTYGFVDREDVAHLKLLPSWDFIE